MARETNSSLRYVFHSSVYRLRACFFVISERVGCRPLQYLRQDLLAAVAATGEGVVCRVICDLCGCIYVTCYIYIYRFGIVHCKLLLYD